MLVSIFQVKVNTEFFRPILSFIVNEDKFHSSGRHVRVTRQLHRYIFTLSVVFNYYRFALTGSSLLTRDTPAIVDPWYSVKRCDHAM